MGGTEEINISAFFVNLSRDALKVLFGGNIGNKRDNLAFQMLPMSGNYIFMVRGHTFLCILTAISSFSRLRPTMYTVAPFWAKAEEMSITQLDVGRDGG